jgi:hypothetical protein
MKTSEILAVLALVFCILLGLAARHNMTPHDYRLEWDGVPP